MQKLLFFNAELAVFKCGIFLGLNIYKINQILGKISNKTNNSSRRIVPWGNIGIISKGGIAVFCTAYFTSLSGVLYTIVGYCTVSRSL